MPFSHRISTTYATAAGTVMNEVENVSGTNQGVDIDVMVPPGMSLAFDVMICPELVQSMMICADQPVTVKTGDATTPVDTITLKAHIGLVWSLNSFWPIPFSPGDILKLFITNDGAADAHFQMRVLSIGEAAP